LLAIGIDLKPFSESDYAFFILGNVIGTAIIAAQTIRPVSQWNILLLGLGRSQ
jgi:hypothetical protein